jgi:hypothetical protein
LLHALIYVLTANVTVFTPTKNIRYCDSTHIHRYVACAIMWRRRLVSKVAAVVWLKFSIRGLEAGNPPQHKHLPLSSRRRVGDCGLERNTKVFSTNVKTFDRKARQRFTHDRTSNWGPKVSKFPKSRSTYICLSNMEASIAVHFGAFQKDDNFKSCEWRVEERTGITR